MTSNNDLNDGFDRIQVIDTHTAGEPTRVVISGGPDLGSDSLAARRERFRSEFDDIRSAIINEPRGSDVLVGALICPPTKPQYAAGVVFFNNVSVLNMCGHGTIGVAVALAHAGNISPGVHTLETSVGPVPFELHDDNTTVTIENVPSYRYRSNVAVDIQGHGEVLGDIAWGGNWFFLVHDHGQGLQHANVDVLTDFTMRIRAALESNGITGENGGEIDHIELCSDSKSPECDSRNFVLCPGGAWDRSPCGTGTSARLACLAADGHLQPGDVWQQESIIGSRFEGTYQPGDNGTVIPRITGPAWVTAEATLLLDPRDPFRSGIRS